METHTGEFGISVDDARRLALDEELSAHSSNQIVVIGCGNILRGDDAVGPTLIRHLWEAGIPDSVTVVDGGTAGMDVAFKMRGAQKVIIIDAAATGEPPGTIFRVPGEELEDLPQIDGLHTHNFRWDHALSFGRWLLADQYPDDITVFLIEVADTTHGADLSEPVAAAMMKAIPMVRAEFEIKAGMHEVEAGSVEGGCGEVAEGRSSSCGDASLIERSETGATRSEARMHEVQMGRSGGERRHLTVTFTENGYLRLEAEIAAEFFPNNSFVAVPHGQELWLMPLIGPEGGGMLLKQRNLAGDRAALVWEVFAGEPPVGDRLAFWDSANGALRVAMGASDE
ncbi:MAG: hydrogenase maturation protease [Acidimicrobiales bacterium]